MVLDRGRDDVGRLLSGKNAIAVRERRRNVKVEESYGNEERGGAREKCVDKRHDEYTRRRK